MIGPTSLIYLIVNLVIFDVLVLFSATVKHISISIFN